MGKNWTARLLQLPVVWGGAATALFYALLRSQAAPDSLFQRYFDSHPTERVAVFLFFVGLASLGNKLWSVARQSLRFPDRVWPAAPEGGQPLAEGDTLLRRLEKLPVPIKAGLLGQRLRRVLEHLRKSGSAEGADAILQQHAEEDAARLHGSYGLVRIIIWAIPIVGFLGTVIGITMAIANLSPTALEESLGEVTAGLAVAFDTTALALGLSMVLMFAQFATDRLEQSLLERVDATAAEEFVGRFQESGTSRDPELALIRGLAENMTQSMERLVLQQVDVWKVTVDAAHQHWLRVAEMSGREWAGQLSSALRTGLETQVEKLISAEESISESSRRHWLHVQQALDRNSTAIAEQQRELAEQGRLLHDVVRSAEQIQMLEHALNKNLAALSGSQDFADTVHQLNATIHLLNTQIRHMRETTPVSRHRDSGPAEKAA